MTTLERAGYRVARALWRIGLVGLALRLAESVWRLTGLPREGRP
jgi:hypothetical protein